VCDAQHVCTGHRFLWPGHHEGSRCLPQADALAALRQGLQALRTRVGWNPCDKGNIAFVPISFLYLSNIASFFVPAVDNLSSHSKHFPTIRSMPSCCGHRLSGGRNSPPFGTWWPLACRKYCRRCLCELNVTTPSCLAHKLF